MLADRRNASRMKPVFNRDEQDRQDFCYKSFLGCPWSLWIKMNIQQGISN
jgi:hypothetical protein